MIVNLFNLKETNGMFFYALDYMKYLGDEVELIVLNKKSHKKFLKHVGHKDVYICGIAGYLCLLVKLLFIRRYLFCPTPHPVPFIRRQLVVVHDAYPFSCSKLGAIKKALFNFGAFISSCDIGYINKTESYSFVVNNSYSNNILIYAPNLIPDFDTEKRFKLSYFLEEGPIHIGLFGSDSAKKNYDSLFDSIVKNYAQTQSLDKFKFLIYGHENPYSLFLIKQYPLLNIKIVSSDDVPLFQFMSDINAAVSVALSEGFGRPIAAAFGLGIPCYFLNTPVNNEFFHGANIYDHIDDLSCSLANIIQLDNFSESNSDAIRKNHEAFIYAADEILTRKGV